MMEEEIIKEIKRMSGSLLGIGIDDKSILDEIEKNDKIDLCYILSNNFGGTSKKRFNIFERGKRKTVNIKKLKKHFKKKSIDNIICNYNIVKPFYRPFVSNSVNINKGKLYLYGNKKDKEKIKEKYLRYTKDIKDIEIKNKFILIINNKKSKNTYKDIIYKIKDFLEDTIDFLTDLLIN